MIGVVGKEADRAVVEEFFQLFKTPWEMFREGRSYDVLVVADGTVPDTDARLLMVYSAALTTVDAGLGISCKATRDRSDLAGGEIQTSFGNLVLHGRVSVLESELRVTLRSPAGALGVEIKRGEQKVVRFGYDLFSEVRHLLTVGQSVAHAQSPSLEILIALLRREMIDAGVFFCEVPPAPSGFDFGVCLTHDIDFIGIRHHKFDHTLAGFLYRSLVASPIAFFRGKLSLNRLGRIWRAAASLPLVHLGLARDFWLPFDWYLKVEKGLNPTYFLIPFKNHPGTKVPASHGRRRASSYGIADIKEWVARLEAEGCEVGVHGLDAWHDSELGKKELEELRKVSSQPETGIRIHWLLRDENTFRVLEKAGYSYDATVGYNETPGYKAGTTQVYKPLEAANLVEVPTHVQDGALFYGSRLGLSEAEAWQCCDTLVQNAQRFGGFINFIWHDRSHGPERFWGDFYARLIDHLRTLPVWFASAGMLARWFRARREIQFSSAEQGGTKLGFAGTELIDPPACVKVYNRLGRNTVENCVWSGIEPAVISEMSIPFAFESNVQAAVTAA